MFRSAVVALVSAAALAVPSAAPAVPTYGAQVMTCPSVHEHNALVHRTLRYSVGGHGGDFHAAPIKKANLKRLGAMRACWKHTYRKAYNVERRVWNREKATWTRYAYLDRITVYGEYVVPYWIIERESHFQYTANRNDGCGNSNPGCYGAYQIGKDHWQRACAGLGTDPAGQHECANAIMHGRNGYPPEGSGAWGGF